MKYTKKETLCGDDAQCLKRKNMIDNIHHYVSHSFSQTLLEHRIILWKLVGQPNFFYAYDKILNYHIMYNNYDHVIRSLEEIKHAHITSNRLPNKSKTDHALYNVMSNRSTSYVVSKINDGDIYNK